jgi:hypothetical protein
MQTDKNIEKVQKQKTKNDSKMKFNLWQIIIQNGSDIVTLSLEYISCWVFVFGIVKALAKPFFSASRRPGINQS